MKRITKRFIRLFLFFYNAWFTEPCTSIKEFIDETLNDVNYEESASEHEFEGGVVVPESSFAVTEADQIVLSSIKANNQINHESSDVKLEESFGMFINYLKQNMNGFKWCFK